MKTAPEHFMDATKADAALQYLYQRHLHSQPNFSLSEFCRAVGISSKGNLSEILAGKRRLPQKYVERVSKFFGLSALEKRFFKTLVQLSYSRTEEERNTLSTDVTELRDALKASHQTMNAPLSEPWVFEIFCAFGVLSKPAMLEQLIALIGCSYAAGAKALKILQENGLVKRKDSHHFELTRKQIMFSKSSNGDAHIKFVERSIIDAGQNVKRFFPLPDQALFISSMISVRRESYLRCLQELRADMELFQSRLESEEADSLLRFNVQIYPVGSPAKKKV